MRPILRPCSHRAESHAERSGAARWLKVCIGKPIASDNDNKRPTAMTFPPHVCPVPVEALSTTCAWGTAPARHRVGTGPTA